MGWHHQQQRPGSTDPRAPMPEKIEDFCQGTARMCLRLGYCQHAQVHRQAPCGDVRRVVVVPPGQVEAMQKAFGDRFDVRPSELAPLRVTLPRSRTTLPIDGTPAKANASANAAIERRPPRGS